MIPFSSQRGLGQDLATHLQNERDNEYMEVAQVRGAVARDLHGAFAEWEAQAHALTKCTNYLYSLSINPDHRQGRLTSEQYLAYADQAEEKLGLSGQPRAVIFHIKHGREHCHVVWSRVDARAGKAVPMAFDHDKLMMVTRLFAREHGLTLPEGYYKEKDGKKRQLSLYEQHQQNDTGLTTEQRMAQITQAWRASDSPKAFVSALGQLGYTLATGKRPYVLVDVYGHTNALPKMIDDRQVRTKDIRAFLEKDYPPDSLPSVEDAQELARQHRKGIEDFTKAGARAERFEQLKQHQAARREKLEGEIATLKARQAYQRGGFAEDQKAERATLKSAYLAKTMRIRLERAARRPRGLAAFLGRVTGVALMTKKLHRYRDRQRFDAFLEEKHRLQDRQAQERRDLDRRHEMQALDWQRKLRALGQIEQRERRSLEESLVRELRATQRDRAGQAPLLQLALKPRGRPAVPHKAKNRYTSPLAREMAEAAKARRETRQSVDPTRDFADAAGEGRTDSESAGGAGGPASAVDKKTRPRRERSSIDLPRTFNEAATQPSDAAGDDGPAGKPDATDHSKDQPERTRPHRLRRTRKPDHDRGPER